MKMLPLITCRNDERKEEVISVSLSAKVSLSYLHESQSNLYLQRNKKLHEKKIKPTLKRIKIGLKSISA